MSDCIFCKIVSKEIPSDIVYEDDEILAFNDINPQAPVHILIIPKKHYENINEVDDYGMVSKMFEVGKKITEQKGIEDFRYVINKGEKAGQTVFHLHMHLIAGRVMNWPPG